MERTLDVESYALVPDPQFGITPGGSGVSPLWRWLGDVPLFEHRVQVRAASIGLWSAFAVDRLGKLKPLIGDA